jgi:glycosyltransferase involved in cell wall biosynthesis
MNHPPSVLFVLPWSLSEAGGVNQVVIHLAREAARRARLRPIIFCVDPAQERFRHEETEGIKLASGRLLSPLSVEQPGRNLAAFAHKLRDEKQTWRKFLQENNVKVVNAHYPSLDYFVFALLPLRKAKIRLLFSLHGTDVDIIEQSGVATRPLVRWMLRKADKVVCCSDDLAKRAHDRLKIDEQRLHTIHNGIDVAELDLAKTNDYRPDIGDFQDYLINVASYEHNKGQDVLLQAYTQLLRNGLRSALVLVGRKTPYLQNLRGMARQLGLQDHVFFIPNLEHTKTLSAIRHARLLVQPSREEAFGIPLLEAGYLGTPIVASRTGGIPEVLGSYYPYLAEPDDPTALASAIDEALFNPTETTGQIKLMKRRVATSFTWGTTYSAYESLWPAGPG